MRNVAPWIPKTWKRITARRLVIIDGMDHYWNFHKKPEPGCPICWELKRPGRATGSKWRRGVA